MKTSFRGRGFSLVELLTVIAIIAILAAVIFPVMGVVKERARQNNCMSNLHQIATGVAMFKTDNRRYPLALVGAIDSNGEATVDPAKAVNFDSAKSDEYLFSEYVPSTKAFHCPSSNIVDTAGVAVVQKMDYDPAVPIGVYVYNSYDVYVTGSVAERHYCTDWADISNPVTRLPSDGGADQADYERQLKFRNPPADTVITWCSYHESRSGTGTNIDYKGNAIVVFLDGSAELVPAAKMETSKWRVKPKKG